MRSWLEEVGWGNWLRALEESSGQVRYLASGLDIAAARLVDAVGWLAGVQQDGRARPRSPRRQAGHKPWQATVRFGGIPRGYAAGRVLMRLVAMPLAIAAGLAPLALAGWWLWGHWWPPLA